METRYYIEKGQTFKEPILALHASKKVFDRITGHLDRNKRIQEEIEKEAAHKKYLRDGTKEMTDKWDNSIDNIRKRKEEGRIQRAAQKADDRVERYYKILKWKEDERKAYNEKVAYRMLMSRGAQYEFNQSLRLSEAHHINAKQIELQKKEKERLEKETREYEEKIIKEDSVFNADSLIKKCKQRTRAKRNQNFLKEQIDEKTKKFEEEKRKRIEEEKEDIVNQRIEMDLIKNIEEERVQKAKKFALQSLKEGRENAEKMRKAEIKQEAEIKLVCDIYNDTKRKIECTRRKLRNVEIEEMSLLQERACKKLSELQSSKLEKENEVISNAMAERYAAEDLRTQLRKEYDERLRIERNQNYEDVLRDKEKKQKELFEIQKWEMLNRVKLMEVLEYREKEDREKAVENTKKIASMWDEQVKEKKRILAEIKEKDAAFIHNEFKEVDARFIEYSEGLLARQRAAGKPTYPLEFSIMRYKKENGFFLPKLESSSEHCPERRNALTISNHKRGKKMCPQKNSSIGVSDCFC